MNLKRFGRPRHHVAWAVGLLVLSTVGLWSERRPLAHTRTSNVTWTEHVGPLLERRCSACHASGHSAAPTLTDYTQAVDARGAIKRAVLARAMPPWGAIPGFGAFENDHTLSAYETDLIVSWIEGGLLPGPPQSIADAPAGHSADAPGDPDLMLDIGANQQVDSTRKTYRLPTSLTADRWIRGWRFLPGNDALVRRARIIVEPDTLLGTWLPDEPAVFFPSHLAQRLRPGAAVLLQIDYAEPPAAASDRSRLGLYFGDPPITPLAQLRIGRGATTLREAIQLVALTPTLTTVGQSVRIVATRPDRSVEPLLWLDHYDPRFARSYRLQRPVLLPRGTQIEVWSFDAGPSVEMTYTPATAAVNAPTAPRTPSR